MSEEVSKHVSEEVSEQVTLSLSLSLSLSTSSLRHRWIAFHLLAEPKEVVWLWNIVIAPRSKVNLRNDPVCVTAVCKGEWEEDRGEREIQAIVNVRSSRLRFGGGVLCDEKHQGHSWYRSMQSQHTC